MHFTDEQPPKSNNEPIHHWAHLEGKSDSMAADLEHQVEDDSTTPQPIGQKLFLCFLVLIFIFAVATLVVTTFTQSTTTNGQQRDSNPQTDNSLSLREYY